MAKSSIGSVASGDAAPDASTLPGGAVSLFVVGFNLVGDSLRDALHPRTRLVHPRMADGNQPGESAG